MQKGGGGGCRQGILALKAQFRAFSMRTYITVLNRLFLKDIPCFLAASVQPGACAPWLTNLAHSV